MTDWALEAAKFGGVIEPSVETDWEKEARKFGGTIVPKEHASWQDRAQAGASGINKGALSYLAGLPVSTALNLADLVRATYGMTKTNPSDMPALLDREKFVMSPEWIQAKIRDAGGSRVIDPNRPDDTVSNIAHSAGIAVGAAPVPGQLAKQALSGGLAQSLIEAGGSPEWATVAGMAPFAPGAFVRKPAQPIHTPEQDRVIQRAKDFGYELTPAQKTGKRWQQNLEAAMKEAPSTSGRMQAIAAKQQELTNSLTEQALNMSGGRVDQGTAGGAAFTGMKEGIAQQAANTGAAYTNLLQGIPVDLAPSSSLLSAMITKQKQLPQDVQGGPALTAAENLAGKPGTPGFIQQNPVVPGEVAQDMRSAYTAHANETTNSQQANIYRTMRKAVDVAIEASVPPAKQGEFKALNTKYSYDKAIQKLEPKDQQHFLEQLYNGNPDQFYTFLGVVNPNSFSTVARGYISRIVERATNPATGNISAPTLGRILDKANPEQTGRADTMKYFGGQGGSLLSDVGEIGRNVLPDQVPNSGTAQRFWYQQMLRGGGAATGGGIGAILGGGWGAAGGAAAGSILGDYVIPAQIQKAYLSKPMQRFLTKQTPSLTAEEELIKRYGGLLGYSASRQ